MTTSTWRALLAGIAATALAPAALGLLPTTAAADVGGQPGAEPTPGCSSDPGGQSGERCPSPGPDPEPDPHASRNPHVSPSPTPQASAASPSPSPAPPPPPNEAGCRDIAAGDAQYIRRSATDVAGSVANLVIFLGGDPAAGQLPVPTCPGVTYTVSIRDDDDRAVLLAQESIQGDGVTPAIRMSKHLAGYAKPYVYIEVSVTEVVDAVLVTHDHAGNSIAALLSGNAPAQTWK